MSGRYTQLDFLRHGEPVGGRRYRGHIDDPLSEKGWSQMRAAVAGERPWTAIVASPLLRCRAFAEWLAAETGLPLSFDERLMEVGFGVWEGLAAADIKAADPAALFNFKRDPVGHRPAGAEPLEAFYGRVAAAYDDILAQHAGAHPLVVAHAGVIRMVLSRVLGMPPAHGYRIQVASAGLVRVRVEHRGEDRHEVLMHLTAGPGKE